jgi:NhaP-type Na+/H+ or K+/H+ antiporter
MKAAMKQSMARLLLLVGLLSGLYFAGRSFITTQPSRSGRVRLFDQIVDTNEERWQSARVLEQSPAPGDEIASKGNAERKKSVANRSSKADEPNVPIPGEDEWVPEDPPTPDEKEKEEPGEALIVYIVSIILLIGGICREIKKSTGIPYTPQLLVVGIGLGMYAKDLGNIGHAFWLLMQINPHGILMIFIPTIIFESAYNSDPFTIKRQIWQILILAVPGVVLGAIFITIGFNYILGYYQELSIWAGLTFGAIICATDPVAVVALLKELGSPLKFNVLLEGESLLNDGTAMVFYIVFSSIYKAQGVTVLGVILKFLQLSIGGVLLGAIACWIAIFWLRRIVKDEILTISITFMACYMTFFVGEVYLGVSGILAIVSLGVLMAMFGKVKINPESEHSVHVVWSFIQYVLETVIFVLTGGYIGYYTIYSEGSSIVYSDWIKMLLFYFLMALARYLMILVSMPLMNLTGYPIGYKDVFILSYGGLRGAIALCLGLMVYTDPDYSQRFRDLVLFYLTGMITLTVIINGLTMKWVMKKVDIFPDNKLKIKVKNTIVKSLVISGIKHEHKIKNNRFLGLCKWAVVDELSGINQLVKNQMTQFIGQELVNLDGGQHLISQEDNLVEIRYRIYRLIKAQFWQKFEENFCSSGVVSVLNECIDYCMDSLENRMWIYECVSDNIIATDKLQRWLSWRNTMLVGRIARSFLNSYLMQTYEMLSTLIVSLEEILHNKPIIPLAQQFVNVVFNEVAINKEKAEQQLFLLCDIFPELIGSIQNRQAAHMILRAQKDDLEEDFHNGAVTDDEYYELMDSLNKRINKLGHQSLSWEIQGLNDFSLVSPIFYGLSDTDLQILKSNHLLNKFPLGTVIYKKSQAINGIYIISSGMVEDRISDDVKMRYGLGAVLSWSNILTSDGLAKSTLTAINATSAFFISKQDIFKIFENNPAFEETVYKISLPNFFKLYPPLNFGIEMTDELIGHIQKNSKLVTKQKGELISIEFGGFLISGEIKLIEDELSRGANSFNTPQFIPPQGNKNFSVKAKTKIIRFEQSILDYEENDDQKSIANYAVHSTLGVPGRSDIRPSFNAHSKPSARNSMMAMVSKEKDIEKLFEDLVKTRFRNLTN